MKLRDILIHYQTLDDNDVIFAEADPVWSCNSEAELVPDAEHRGTTLEINGRSMIYFLEADLTKDVIRVWREWHGYAEPTIEQICKAVIYYAEHDAFIGD